MNLWPPLVLLGVPGPDSHSDGVFLLNQIVHKNTAEGQLERKRQRLAKAAGSTDPTDVADEPAPATGVPAPLATAPFHGTVAGFMPPLCASKAAGVSPPPAVAKAAGVPHHEAYRQLIHAVVNPNRADDHYDQTVRPFMHLAKAEDRSDQAVRWFMYRNKQRTWKFLFETMYRCFNPAKLAELDTILHKYRTFEAKLYRALCDKYIPTIDAGTLQELCD
eukprot:7805379-Lingulodinium_polyedra.AAC.1